MTFFKTMLWGGAAAMGAACSFACSSDAPCSQCAEPPPWEPPKSDASVDVSTSDVSATDVATTDTVEPDAEASVDAPIELPPLPASCPDDMVPIPGGCMDVYEASREDGTEESQGEGTVATSRKGVMPWQPVNLATARAACDAAGKRLCRLDEWVWSCHGPENTVYGYGNTYDPLICNGIDTFCDCSGSCASAATCPYPRCFNMPAQEDPSIGPCGASFRVMPTGAFPDCTNAYGVFDINGNVWELADSDDGEEHFRGGAYNCADTPALHRCDHDGTWGPTARGFRCCSDGS